MEIFEDRILAGLVKSAGVETLERARDLLAGDVDIIVEPARMTVDDLWPCVWALASALVRQFSGVIRIHPRHSGALVQPVHLGNRCLFSSHLSAPIQIFVGIRPPDDRGLWGDTRGREIACGDLIRRPEPAHPIGCFALAGYLGFSALATAAGIPFRRTEHCGPRLSLPAGNKTLPDEVTIVGLGQLGQSYLSLLYFIARQNGLPLRLMLVDKDRFELPNQRTQILLDDTGLWLGHEKAPYLARLANGWGWATDSNSVEVTWDWRRPAHYPTLALLGLDDLDVRRMAVNAGFDWIIESGVGTSFSDPRISWHSLPADNEVARRLFASRSATELGPQFENSALKEKLENTPGKCGWVTFQSVSATAPSMGIAAAAYAISEMMNDRKAISGRASLWSQLLPFLRENLQPE